MKNVIYIFFFFLSLISWGQKDTIVIKFIQNSCFPCSKLMSSKYDVVIKVPSPTYKLKWWSIEHEEVDRINEKFIAKHGIEKYKEIEHDFINCQKVISDNSIRRDNSPQNLNVTPPQLKYFKNSTSLTDQMKFYLNMMKNLLSPIHRDTTFIGQYEMIDIDSSTITIEISLHQYCIEQKGIVVKRLEILKKYMQENGFFDDNAAIKFAFKIDPNSCIKFQAQLTFKVLSFTHRRNFIQYSKKLLLTLPANHCSETCLSSLGLDSLVQAYKVPWYINKTTGRNSFFPSIMDEVVLPRKVTYDRFVNKYGKDSIQKIKKSIMYCRQEELIAEYQNKHNLLVDTTQIDILNYGFNEVKWNVYFEEFSKEISSLFKIHLEKRESLSQRNFFETFQALDSINQDLIITLKFHTSQNEKKKHVEKRIKSCQKYFEEQGILNLKHINFVFEYSKYLYKLNRHFFILKFYEVFRSKISQDSFKFLI